jgi:hypothetical protein
MVYVKMHFWLVAVVISASTLDRLNGRRTGTVPAKQKSPGMVVTGMLGIMPGSGFREFM